MQKEACDSRMCKGFPMLVEVSLVVECVFMRVCVKRPSSSNVIQFYFRRSLLFFSQIYNQQHLLFINITIYLASFCNTDIYCLYWGKVVFCIWRHNHDTHNIPCTQWQSVWLVSLTFGLLDGSWRERLVGTTVYVLYFKMKYHFAPLRGDGEPQLPSV